MEMTNIINAAGAVAQEIEAVQADHPLPQYVPTSARGKVGYDHVVDAMNRLPRPALAMMTLALFLLAGFNPPWFEARMQALAAMPEPMWWIIGAVITFFFGARESHYIRNQPPKS